ncbi:hypothetical protein BWI93_11605 [Siphonobacter sp. BAB-5385]|uniref:helix-turn-helix domain-containing protein n=1 Tax=Siphonobacter sp. BAB-5385 TaxID=1864822 RepID=UPI000B9EA8D6|nr:helix-turn-helix transcriptional regulator [Siphonobacter sp. BAB-5385]OZI07994.1 hypothetical protein BWI93_11605 [Siphonobacter sp. BAB-5385]
MPISERLIELIQEQGLKQREVAEKLELQQSSVSMILKGGKTSLETLIKAADIFGVTLDWLVLGIGHKYRNQSFLVPVGSDHFTKEDIEQATQDKQHLIEVLKKSLEQCQRNEETYRNLYLKTQQQL